MAQSSAAFNLIFGAKTDQLEKALRTVDGRLRKTAASFNKMGRSLSGKLTAPLVAIGATSFQAAANFEQSMAKVAAVSGATGKQFQALEDNARELGRTTRFTASDVSALQLEFAKLGFTSEEITQVTGATLALAQASGSDLAQAAEVAGATLRGFGLDVSETGHVADVMAASFASSALDLGSFQDSMKFVAPVAKAAGVSLEKTAAMLAQLANSGVKGSAAGTALRRILSEVAGSGEDLETAFASTAEEVINLSDAKDAVGRTAQSAFLILKEGMGDLDGLTQAFENSDGAAKAMADTMDDTAQGALARMGSAVEGAQISIGKALSPAVVKVADKIGELAAKFEALDSGTKRTTVVVAALVAGLGPLLIAMAAVIRSIRTMRTAMASLNTTIKANPIGALITVVTIAVGLLYDYGTAAHAASGDEKTFGDEVRNTNTALEQRNQLITDALDNQDDDTASVADLKAELSGLRNELENLSARSLDEVGEAVEALEIGDVLPEGEFDLAPRVAQAVYDELNSPEVSDAFTAAMAAAADADEIEAAMNAATETAIANVAANLRTRIGELETAVAAAEKRVTGTGTGSKSQDKNKGKKPTFEVDLTPTEEAFNTLSETIAEIEGRRFLDGNDVQAAKDLAAAYERAAQAAAAAGDVAVAEDLRRESREFLAAVPAVPIDFEVDDPTGLSGVYQQLSDSLNQAAAAFEVTGDQVANAQAVAAAYTQAATAAIAAGEDSALTEQLTAEAQAAQQLADNLEKAQEKLDANQDKTQELTATTQAFSQAIQDTIGAAIAGEEDLGKVVAQAGRSILAALLAETLGTAIRNAFQSASASGPAAAVVGPALAAGAVGAVTSLFNGIPALASGGITLGPTLALIGDNPGGREVVMPLDRLRSMMDDRQRGGGRLQVSGRLSGRDLILSGERSQRLTDRTYGPRR